MIKIMIVDDEPLVRIGIKMSIDWVSNGFILVGDAANGKEALLAIKETKPEIVLTDIKMPIMDGLELIKEVREVLPKTQFVILSGYNDFEYVREAMKYNVSDYILKLSLKPEQLLELLLNIKKNIQKEKREEEEKINIKARLEASILEVKESLLKKIILGEYIDYGKFWFQVGKSLKIENRDIFIMLVLIDHYYDVKNRDTFVDETLWNLSVRNMIKHTLVKYVKCEIVRSNIGEFVIMINSRNELTKEYITKIFKDINMTLNLYFYITVSLSVSSIASSFLDLKKCYKDCKKLISKRFFYKENILLFNDLKKEQTYQKSNTIYSNKIEKRLFNSLELLNIKEVFLVLDKLFHIMVNETNISKQIALQNLKEVLFTYFRVFKLYRIDTIKLLAIDKKTLIKQLEQVDDIELAKIWFESLTKKFVDNIKNKKKTSYSREVEEVKKYLNENYMKEISLSIVAKHINMNGTYLSNLFSKYVGVSFIEYLTDIRINKAKEYLIEGNLKVYEIASRVGYLDEHYFSKVFKKIVGISPLEFKKLKI